MSLAAVSAVLLASLPPVVSVAVVVVVAVPPHPTITTAHKLVHHVRMAPPQVSRPLPIARAAQASKVRRNVHPR